jgi:spore germination protein GerM
MNRPRALARVALVLGLSLALAGCVGIPSSGGVTAGGVITEKDDFPFAVLPSGPQVDSTPAEILTDFMQAETSPEGNYQIARQFLTASAAESWNPNTSVLIREGSGTMNDTDPSTIAYSVSTKASVNSFGLYSEDLTQSTQELTFSFSQVKGQWRISKLEDGTVVSRDNFDAAFDAHALYFFDPSYHYLVPDVRWFPTRSSVPTRIVNALLSGQASWLQQGATLTAFPQGAQLATPVSVQSGRATVDLSDEVASASPIEKARMQQQLEASLGTVSVNTVVMTVRSVPIVVADPGVSSATVTPAVDSEPLVRQGSHFGFATSDGLTTINNLSTKIVAATAKAVTLAQGQGSAAVLGAAGVSLVTDSDAAPILLDNRPGLIAPSIDTSKYVWTVPASNASAIEAIGPDKVVHPVASTLPADTPIVSLAVSRDGTRVLLYLNTDAGPRLKVAAILRRDGVPAGLGELVDLPVAAGVPIDATWADDRTVAAIALTGGLDEVTEFPIGGPIVALGTAQGGTTIVGGNGADQLRVLGADGTVLQRRASGWQSTGVTADVLATQQ